MEPLRITSADNPRIKAVVKLGEQRDRRKTGLFVAEGRRQVARAIGAGLALQELYFCAPLLERHAPDESEKRAIAQGQRSPGVRTFEVTPQLMAKMAYRENPEGVLAVFAQPVRDWALLEKSITSKQEPALLLVAVGTSKPGNLGAMVRSASAAGAAAVLVGDAVVDPFHPNAIHASTGAVFTLPVVSAPSAEIRAFLKQHGIALLAATPAGDTDYSRADMAGAVALVIGTEDVGLDAAWLDAAKAPSGAKIVIPMPGQAVDSLNASTAAAVLLFEAVRQRRNPAPSAR